MSFHGRNADIGAKEQQKINDQETEIARLQEQLQTETEKHAEQLERINLMSSELKELQSWKEIEKQSYEGKLSEYEHQLQESHRKQSDYAEQVQLLALKLEAVEFVARQRQPREKERGESKSHEQRVQVLRSELDSVRAKYLKMLINSVQDSAEEGDKVIKDQKMQVEEEMNIALQAAFESAFDTIDNEWSVRYETLENHLSNITEYAANLAKERDSALQEADASFSAKAGQKLGSSDLSKSKKEQFREELTAELTASLTDELTEKLTKQLTITLVKNIETKYKKKFKRLRKDLKIQQAKASELERSQEDMIQQQIEVEIEKVKDQYKQEYESKLHQLQIENEAQVRMQKERMRKLVRALLEREAKQKGEKAEESNATAAEKIKSPSRKKKRRGDSTSGDGATDAGGNPDDTIVPASLAGSRRRSTPGVVSVRGNR
ncbi:hypothetical protein ACHAW5_000572 [Stephanodiscus triporus]|uniref:Uncharacterized protein n=1 Tax=Stephanodiscus triporus TaxID=2934178 RepID=A0ABD3QGZ8_9STRA